METKDVGRRDGSIRQENLLVRGVGGSPSVPPRNEIGRSETGAVLQRNDGGESERGGLSGSEMETGGPA
jgi:hypothetical protein